MAGSVPPVADVAAPRVSVVVPIYDVESYLAECLDSIVHQTFSDLEVVLVDDGSTDGSAAIARDYVDRDPRFRLISQPNGGLGRARNVGADAARGEFLAFVDSDDKLALNFCELLVGALDQSGSDFATGNVLRFNRWGTRQAPFLTKAFTKTRMKTHVRSFRALLVDRIAPNKLWRRTFWDAHGLRFPEGVVHEDVPVVVPAHFMARSVDVIAEHVYLYREREGDDLSITQRRAEQKMLEDRLAAVESVTEFLGAHEDAQAQRWYRESVVAEDLRYYLNVLDEADDAYRQTFLDRVNAYLDEAGPDVEAPLPAIDRLKYHLVRRRLLDELLEVLRFQKQELPDTVPIRVRGAWYGDYPYREDERLAIPESIYRLGVELRVSAGLDALSWDENRLCIDGWAFIHGAGAQTPDAQSVSVIAVRPGRFARLRRHFLPMRLRVTPTHRPDVNGPADVQWSGFHAVLDLRRLRRMGRWKEQKLDILVIVRNGNLTRRISKFAVAADRPVPAVERHLSTGVLARAGRASNGTVRVGVHEHWAQLLGHQDLDGAIDLHGELRLADHRDLSLEVTRRGAVAQLVVPVIVAAGSPRRFQAVVDLSALTDPDGAPDDGGGWQLWLTGNGVRERVGLATTVRAGTWDAEALGCPGTEFALTPTPLGDAALVQRSRTVAAVDARWEEDGTLRLVLQGEAPGGELVLSGRDHGGEHTVALNADGAGSRIRVPVGRMPSLDGGRRIAPGTWELRVRDQDGARERAVVAGGPLRDRLPLAMALEHGALALVPEAQQRLSLVVQRDLRPDERGPYNRGRLRRHVYGANRCEPVRDIVAYSSFGGRQYSDSPRAIHQELVRRDLPLEHVWVVRDGLCNVAPGTRVVREGSREHHELLAVARYVVVNDHPPDWFVRRSDQVCLHTWSGVPLKRQGPEAPRLRLGGARKAPGAAENLHVVVAPNDLSADILRRAYGDEPQMLVTGLPRDDVLQAVSPAAADRLRQRLGLGAQTRTVLYAPTYRDHLVDGRGGYRLDSRLDVDRLRSAVGEDTVILYRKHPYVEERVPVTADGFVRDVSSYPDTTELLSAADVLVTDYSSAMFDFANSGRPMLFYTYDLELYENDVRGFSFDFAGQAPGPLLRTGEQLVEALSEVDGVRQEYDTAYRRFRSDHCALDDGQATARVVDQVFDPAR
ncbi:MAG: putative glycosyltransferase [Solirubrobacterales bacterium]|nr:putative glycosyltransferase [Solirubrobacterales bacterium]